jgi:hypothetical protein
LPSRQGVHWTAFSIKTVKVLRSEAIRVDDRTTPLFGNVRNERPFAVQRSYVQSIYQRDYTRAVNGTELLTCNCILLLVNNCGNIHQDTKFHLKYVSLLGDEHMLLKPLYRHGPTVQAGEPQVTVVDVQWQLNGLSPVVSRGLHCLMSRPAK